MDTYLFFTIWTSNKNDKRKLPIIRDGSEFDHVYEIIISHLLIDIKLPFRMFNLIFTSEIYYLITRWLSGLSVGDIIIGKHGRGSY
jgi:hypothetical protein